MKDVSRRHKENGNELSVLNYLHYYPFRKRYVPLFHNCYKNYVVSVLRASYCPVTNEIIR